MKILRFTFFEHFIALALFITLLVIGKVNAATITSQQSGNWTATSTWVGGTPPATTDDVVIDNSHTVTLTGNVTCNDLTINSTGVLDVTASNFAVTVTGNTDLQGSFTAHSGTFYFSGTSIQTLTSNGNSLYNFTINNSQSTNTGFMSPSASGDDHNQWTSIANTYVSDNVRSREDRNNQKQDWYSFGFSIPLGSTIDGIEVQIEANDPLCNSANGADVDLSWDGGASYTSSGKSFTGSCTTDLTHNLGGSTDTWGRTWDATEFSNAHFRIRLNKNGNDWDPTDVDHIQVKVFYTGPGKVTLSDNITIQNDLTFTKGELDANGNSITILGNWNNTNGTFTPGSGTVTFNGSAVQTISNSGGETFSNLTINNTTDNNAITLSDPITVTGLLTMTNGDITTSSTNILTLTHTGSFVLNGSPQDNSFVNGPMKHTVAASVSLTKVFPLGKNNWYRRVDWIIDQDAATTTQYTAELIASDATSLGYTLPGTIDRVSNVNYYLLDQQSTGVGLDNSTVEIYYKGDDEVTDPANLAVAKDNGSGDWIDLGGTATGAPSGTITSGSFTTDIGRFSLANKTGGGNPLPVEMLDFSGIANGMDIQLNWVTASEQNSDFFLLEKSPDGKNFTTIAKIDAAGNSTTARYYAFTDSRPAVGANFYRLRQTDIGGNYTYSNMVNIIYQSTGSALNIYPNPNVGSFVVNMASGHSDENRIRVINLVGNEVAFNMVDLPGQQASKQIELDPVPGIYFVELSYSDRKETKKVIVK